MSDPDDRTSPEDRPNPTPPARQDPDKRNSESNRSPHSRIQIRQPKWLLWSVVPAILLVATFGLWLRLTVTGPTPLDQSWLEFAGLEPGTFRYAFAVAFAEVGGGTGAMICTALIAIFFVLFRRYESAARLVTAMLIGIALSELFKLLFERLRPSVQLYDSTGYSYPSGHSMGAAALAISLAFIYARSRAQRRHTAAVVETMEPNGRLGDLRLPLHPTILLALVWITVMMWSRTALQVHWLTDTIAGSLLGICAAILADEAWTTITAKRAERKRLSPH